VAGNVWTDPNRRFSITIPNGWIAQPQLVAQMQSVLPGYTLSIVNPQTQCGVDVVYFNGATRADQVIQTFTTFFRGLGLSVEVGEADTDTIGGKEASVVPMIVNTPAAQVAGAIAVVRINGGMIAFNAGGPRQNLQAALPELEAVMETVKLGN
jgi:hypothetical protein